TGRLNTATLTTQYRPNPHLAFAVNNTLNSFRLPQGNFNIELAGVQVSYAFNRFLNATTFVQTDTAQNQAVSANFRVRYTFRPDSDLYVIYNVEVGAHCLVLDRKSTRLNSSHEWISYAG